MPESSPNNKGSEIEQRLAELPQDVRDAVLSAQLGENVRKIGQGHGLHIDQIGTLEDEVMLVMLGFFEPEAFSGQIAAQLQIPAADAGAIAGEVNQQIFLPIRESLKRFSESKRLAKPAQNLPALETPPTNIPITIAPTPPVASTSVSTPQQNPVAPSQTASEGSAQAKPPMPPMPNAEKMLTQTTVAKPIYKADPYREPIEP